MESLKNNFATKTAILVDGGFIVEELKQFSETRPLNSALQNWQTIVCGI